MEDSSLISALSSATDTDGDGWLNYGAEEYAKVSSASPDTSGYKSDSGNVTFSSGSTYYFKVEPIKWRVLSTSSGDAFLLSDRLLQPLQYYSSTSSRMVSGSTVYPNNYKYSNLRAWMNGLDGSSYNVANYAGKGFLNLAFKSSEASLIKTTTVDNSASTTGNSSNSYACANTSDKVFALSVSEVMNTAYGFFSYYSGDPARMAKPTDYAVANGAYVSTDSSYYGNGYWRLRSPGWFDSDNAGFVNYGGRLYYGSTIGDVDYGVRPALHLSI